MTQTAVATTTQHVNPLVYQPLKTISLNYNEVQCLRMAIYFLTEQLGATPRHHYFTALCKHHVNGMSDWLDNSPTISSLRFDGKNSASWRLTPLVDVEWLLLALDVGLTEDTLTAMAADDANYDYDMTTYADDPNYREINDSEAGSEWIGDWQGYFNYYCQFLSHKTWLLTKLRVLVDD